MPRPPRRRSAACLTALALASGAVLLGACARPAEDPAAVCDVVHGPGMLPDIPETSGLAVSRRHAGLLWSHNDSGHAAILFALDATGAIRARVRVPVRTRDWEDLSIGRCPSGTCLYIADIGDNAVSRPQVYIYRVPEPGIDQTDIGRPDVFAATYADGPHNAEALFVLGTDLFIVTKDRTGGLYRATAPSTGSSRLTFHRIGELGLTAVTGAAASPDDASVVVRTYDAAVVYRSADLARGVPVPYHRVPLDGFNEPQGEGIAMDARRLYLTSEGSPSNPAGRLLVLDCD